MGQALFILMLLSPFFGVVVIALIVYGVIARDYKRQEEKQKLIRQIRAGHGLKKAQPQLTPGFLVRRGMLRVFSGVVWLMLAIILSVALFVLFNWRAFWEQSFGSGTG